MFFLQIISSGRFNYKKNLKYVTAKTKRLTVVIKTENECAKNNIKSVFSWFHTGQFVRQRSRFLFKIASATASDNTRWSDHACLDPVYLSTYVQEWNSLEKPHEANHLVWKANWISGRFSSYEYTYLNFKYVFNVEKVHLAVLIWSSIKPIFNLLRV